MSKRTLNELSETNWRNDMAERQRRRDSLVLRLRNRIALATMRGQDTTDLRFMLQQMGVKQ